MAFWKQPKGQTSLEALIALVLFVFMAVSAFRLFAVSLTQNTLSQERQLAQEIEQEGFEASRQIRNQDWEALTVGTHGLALSGTQWIFTGTEDVQGIYHRSVEVQAVNDNERDVLVTVEWGSALYGQIRIQAGTRLSYWQSSQLPLASNCLPSSAISGDWSNPLVLGSADIGAGNQGTDVAVKFPYVFVSGVAASSSKPDLFVYDVTNPAVPSLVKSVETGADGISSLSLVGNYLYAASNNDSSELMVFDVTDPLTTAKIGGANLSGNANGLSILASDHWVALGRAINTAGEVYIYDVTVPSTPSLVATFEASADVNDFATDSTYLYAVNSATTNDLQLINMTQPITPVLTSTVSLNDGGVDMSVAYQDSGVLFIGNSNQRLLTVDVTNPLQVVTTSTFNVGGTVKDLFCVVDRFLYAGTTNSTMEFQVLNSVDPSAVSLYSFMNFAQVATGVGFANNMVFLSVRSNDALRIITSSP